MAVTLKIELNQVSQSITNNTSKVRARVYATSTQGSYNNDACSGWLKLNGVKYTFSHSFSRDTTTLLYDTTRTISHNSDGSKTVSSSASFATDVSSGTITASKSLTLTKIPRQSIIKSFTSGFNVEGTTKINITKYLSSYNQNLKVYFSNGTLLKTINGVENGDLLSFTTAELEKIFTKYYNNKKVSFKMVLDTYSGSTKIGSSEITATGSILNANPVITDIFTEDVNEQTRNLTGDYQKYIKGHSKLYCEIKAVPQKNAKISHFVIDGNSFDAIYDEENDIYIGQAYLENVSKNTIEVYAVDTRQYNSSQLITLDYLTYFDIEKGAQDIQRLNNVYEQVDVEINGTFWNGQFNEETENSLTASYKYKLTNETTWEDGSTPIELVIEDCNFSFKGSLKGDTDAGFNIEKSYDLILTVSDLMSVAPYKFRINSGKPAIAIYGNKVSLGDKYNEELGGTQIYGDLLLNEIKMAEPNYVQFYKTADEESYNVSYNYFAPFNGDDEITPVASLGESLKITKKSLAFGDRDSESSVWGIEVGKGVKCIFASAGVRYGNPNFSDVAISTFFYRNREGKNVIYGSIADTITKARYTGVLNYLIPVEEGDFVYVVGYRSVKSVDIDVMSANASTSFRAFAIG